MTSPATVEKPCLLCGQGLRRDAVLSLGSLPACNRFSEPDGETHPLSLAECSRCNLIQLFDVAPPAFVRPRFSWIRYNEPAAHLPDLAAHLRECLPAPQPVVMGIGPFEVPLLDQVSAWAGSALALDVTAFLPQEAGRFPYLESLQEVLRPDPLATLATEQGQADLVTCRYLLEHSHDPVASLRGLGQLLKPDGLLLIEIPDSSKFLAARDYSFIWEEHLCYFTEASMRLLAAQAGYTVSKLLRYPGALEDALVFILSPGAAPAAPLAELGQSPLFAGMLAGLAPARQSYREAISVLRAQGQKVAIFGAGHQAIMFINALGLQAHIDYVIDDAPDKLGHTIPGTTIPIVASTVLAEDPALRLCLLALAPAAEAKIREKFAAFLERGGHMFSIFPGTGGPLLTDAHS